MSPELERAERLKRLGFDVYFRELIDNEKWFSMEMEEYGGLIGDVNQNAEGSCKALMGYIERVVGNVEKRAIVNGYNPVKAKEAFDKGYYRGMIV